MADNPSISVIVRSMARPSLTRALESIRTQQYESLETLVVDAKGDGQADIAAIGGIGDSGSKLISHGKPLSRAAAANAGLHAARRAAIHAKWAAPFAALRAAFDSARTRALTARDAGRNEEFNRWQRELIDIARGARGLAIAAAYVTGNGSG